MSHTPNMIHTSRLHEIPTATNTAGVAVVTFSTDLDLNAEGIAAGDLFKYLDEKVIYTIQTVDSAIQVTLNETIKIAHTDASFIIAYNVTASKNLYQPRKGDLDWDTFLRRNYMIIDRELGVPTVGGTKTTAVNVISATDNRTAIDIGDTDITPWKFIPKQGGGDMYATVTTGANIDSTAYLKLGVKALLLIKETSGASAGVGSVVFIYQWSTGTTPGTWTTFQMHHWPGEQNEFDANSAGDYFDLNDVAVVPISLSPSTVYNVTVRVVSDEFSSNIEMDCNDSTNSTTRKIWAVVHNNQV